MKKFLNLSASLLTAVALLLPMTGCEHTHKFGAWRHEATEHWRVCTEKGCTNPPTIERGEHVGYPCEICGPAFKAVAFYTGINDQAHVSFVYEADKWFQEQAKACNFTYESTNDWRRMNDTYLSKFDLVMFFDTRPEQPDQREAFERFMENGGAWIGFHFSAFAMKGSAYEQDWDWYHEEFLGSGQYVSNTWEPTTAVLQVETHDHIATANLPDTFESTACEWYRWEHDLRENPDIDILASIHESSFPLGNKAGEIWTEGYYPVVWSNKNYKMMYLNMGHNLVNYYNYDPANYDTSKDRSKTFENETQNRMILDAMFGFTQ